MKRLLIVVLAVLLAPSTVAAQTDWVTLAKSVRDSIVEIAVDGGACTGFVSDANVKDGKDDYDYVVTAAHCDGTNMVVDLQPAEVKAKDFKSDLMVLRVKDTGRPALRLATDNPKVGAEVASYGFGFALDQPLFRVAHVSSDKASIGERVEYLTIDGSFVPGQSGGPVVNTKGEVVMIVQLGSDSVGFGVGADRIRDKVGRYFGKVQ